MTKKPKRWSYSAGERGRNRVRVFENRLGLLYLEFYEHTERGLKARRTSLKHRDRAKAKRQVDQIAAAFAVGESADAADPTLGQLFDNYEGQVTGRKGPRKQNHDRQAMEMFLKLFGRKRKASSLTAVDWSRFIELRRAGHIGGRPVGDRTVEYDLRALLAILNWAVKTRVLTHNPLRGLALPREKNPHRPVATQEEYEALLGAARGIDWRFALALVVVHETGHRIGAVRRLKWSDIDLEERLVTWRAANDKTGREHTTPLTTGALEALRSARREQPVIGDAWLLPGKRDPSKPVSGSTLQQWMQEARSRVGLEKRRALGFHSLRRKFATELRHIPVKDLMTLGGWRDHSTILTCYQHPDMDAMRNALHERSESTQQSTHPPHTAGAR